MHYWSGKTEKKAGVSNQQRAYLSRLKWQYWVLNELASVRRGHITVPQPFSQASLGDNSVSSGRTMRPVIRIAA